MKRIATVFLLFFVFSYTFSVSADTPQDIYDEIYDKSEISQLQDGLSEEITKIISELGIDLKSFTSFLDMQPQSLWSVIIDMLGRNITTPLTVFSLALAVILICSTLGGMWPNPIETNQSFTYICLLSLSSVVLIPMTSTVDNCISGIKSVSGFMLTFVPVYAGLMLSSGQVTSAAVYQSIMLGISELVSQVAGFIIAPTISIFICIGMASAIAGIDGTYKLAMTIKNVANWILGFFMTLFTGFLSVQSVIGKSADNLTIKTTRFFVGSTVPVVGGYLSEALTTVVAGLGILRSTAAAWCVLVLALMVLPLIIELFLWRISLNLLSAVSEIFVLPEASKLFQVCSVALGFLVAIILSVSVMFILSLVILKGGA